MTTQQQDLARDYATLAARLTDAVEAVPDWDEPSTCAGWTRRDVLDHLVSTQRDPVRGPRVRAPGPHRCGRGPGPGLGRARRSRRVAAGGPGRTGAGVRRSLGRTTLGRTLADLFGDALRWDGVCGPAVEVTAGADRQTRLLGRLGRAA